MILGIDTHPERNIYYWAAKVLEILSSKDTESFNSFSIYEELRQANNLSVDVFLLTLDWLFILGAINGEKGLIKKCF